MKICKRITAWTDYPIESLGDKSGAKAPIRHVLVIGYDGNKYATVEILGWDVVASIKCGYLYRKHGRYGESKPVNHRKLERMAQGSTP
jgi:hypothetical protein